MKKHHYLRQQGQTAALKCGALFIIFIAAVTWGVVAFLHDSSVGIAACWAVAMLSIVGAVHFGSESNSLLDRAFITEMDDLVGRNKL